MVTFSKVKESEITRTIVERFTKEFLEYVDSDAIIVGAGPAGLTAARDLALAGSKVLVLEGNNYLGGGFWIGGYLMNQLTVRHPGQEVLEEIGAPFDEVSPGLYAAFAPHACSKLIAATCDAGARIVNMTSFDDVVLGEGDRVRGAVINWTPVGALPRAITCVDPVAIEGKVLIDASGHDAVVAKSLADRGLLELRGMGAMWVNESEDAIVEHTGEVHPGLIVAGMAVSTVHGLPRMGPTFGGMLLSGKKAAQEALKAIAAHEHETAEVLRTEA
ncbi:MAG: sulfide-dependent adenosine diphosphate thiazole synthase [Armatimonadota bacterium]